MQVKSDTAVPVKEAVKGLSEDDKVDRYVPSTPNHFAVTDLDEKHVTLPCFRTQQGMYLLTSTEHYAFLGWGLVHFVV